jgi:excisionase family DNA binding protein
VNTLTSPVATVVTADHGQDGNGAHQPTQAPTQGLTIDQAAAALSVSVTTVRRQIKQGRLCAEKVDGAHGPEYRIHLGDGQLSTVVDDNGHRADHRRHAAAHSDQPGVASLVELVRELRAENSQLQQERFELAGRLGYFQAELEHTRETIKVLQAPASVAADEAVPEPAPPASRPWWRFW